VYRQRQKQQGDRAILYISEATVKGHVRSILTKLEAIGRAEAIAIATKRGLIHANILIMDDLAPKQRAWPWVDGFGSCYWTASR
jgi:predicted nucleic acid-binding protein